jgi:ATP-dependent DNA ligase
MVSNVIQEGSTYGNEAEMAATHWEINTSDQEPGVDIAAIIAELDDRDLEDMPPVYDTLDHMIDTLFSDPPAPDAQAVLEFTYDGYRVNLNQDGHATFMKIATVEGGQ